MPPLGDPATRTKQRASRGWLRRAATLGALATALSLAPEVAARHCIDNSDCGSGAICNEGQCFVRSQDPPPYPPAAARSHSPVGKAGGDTSGGRLVDVKFAPKSGKAVLVADVASGKRCIAPCTLQLRPGGHQIRIGGRGYRWPVSVPEEGGQFTVAERSTGGIIAGIIMSAVGGGLMVYGYVITKLEDSLNDSCDLDGGCGSDTNIGPTLFGAGLGVGVIGLVFLVSAERGGFERAVGPRRSAVGRRPALLPFAEARPGGGMMGLSWTF